MKPTLALQVYSIRDLYAADKVKAFALAKSSGYDAVELFGGMDTPAAEMKKMLDDAGLAVAGYHTQWSWLDDEHFDATVAYNKTIGNKFIIVPALPGDMINSAKAWENTNALFNEMETKLAKVGMRFGFHSHKAEHTRFDDGSYGWECFGSGTKDSVIMQLDLGNCMSGGFDPVQEYEKWVSRGVTVHFKPYSLATGYACMIGADDIDWEKAVSLAQNIGICEFVIVEYEDRNGTDAIAVCARALRALGV